MPGAKKNFIGLEGFIWWIGVVEDRQDPEQLGRVRVRCFGFHTENKNKIPTDSLPWAHPMIPVNSPNAYSPKEGDMVMGFFMDGENAQNPVIMGVLPGKPDKKPDYQIGFSDPAKDLSARPNKPNDATEAYPKGKYIKESSINRLSRNKSDSTVIATRTKNLIKDIKSADDVTWSEPSPAFNPTYPYNNALETESGHALEFDDTPGQERVHMAHRMGSFFEIDKDGNKVEKVVKDNYELVMGSDYVYIKGSCAVTIGGDCNLKVVGKINVEAAEINMAATGDIKLKAGKAVKVQSGTTTDMSAAQEFNLSSGSAFNIKSGSAMNIQGGGNISLKAPAVASSPISTPKLDASSATISTLSAGSTDLKATGSDTRGDGHNLSVAGSGSASVTSASAAASASDSGLSDPSTGSVATEPSSTNMPSQETATPTEGYTVGKTVEGGTSTVSNVYSALSEVSAEIAQDLISDLPIGELTNKIQNLEYDINSNRGMILDLEERLQGPLLEKIQTVAQLAIDKDIDFNIDLDIQNKINEIPYPASKYTTIIGKHIYPKTESVLIPSANSA